MSGGFGKRFEIDDLIAKGFVLDGKGGYTKDPTFNMPGVSSKEEAAKIIAEAGSRANPGKFEMRVNAPSGTGIDLEEKIVELCRRYQERGIRLDLEKVDPPTKVVGKRPNLNVVFLPNPFVDFIGVYKTPGGKGISIHIEAKSTKCVNPLGEGKMRIDSEGGGITPNQFIALRRWHRAGSYVGVIWQCGNIIRWVSFRTISTIRSKGIKHIRFAQAQPLGIGNGVSHDFLTNLINDYKR